VHQRNLSEPAICEYPFFGQPQGCKSGRHSSNQLKKLANRSLDQDTLALNHLGTIIHIDDARLRLA
jgi:hypothetical protein